MSTSSINLRHLRLLTGKSQGNFAEEIGVAQSTLSTYESAHRAPSARVLNAVRFRFHVPQDYFHEPIKFYRANELLFRSARTGRAQVEQITAAFSIVEHYLRKQHPNLVSELPKLPIPTGDQPLSLGIIEDLAAKTRDHFGLPQDAYIRNITEVLHAHGILVTSLTDDIVNESNFDGVSSPHSENPRIIVLNRQRNGARLRFSLAHELGHLLLHANAQRSDRNQMETEANIFAGAFLMPRALLEGTITPELTLADYIPLKTEWGYSMQAIIRRSHEIGLLDYNRYRSLRMQISGRGWAINEPGTVLLETERITPIQLLRKNPTPQDSSDTIASVIPLRRLK